MSVSPPTACCCGAVTRHDLLDRPATNPWRTAIGAGVFFATRRVCRDFARSDQHPLRGWTGTTVEGGGFSAGP